MGGANLWLISNLNGCISQKKMLGRILRPQTWSNTEKMRFELAKKMIQVVANYE